MSEPIFAPMVPMMTAAEARDLARGLKWLANSYASHGMTGEARRHERESEWWLGYASTLALTERKPGGE
jgi:hypothetical protein